MTTEQASSQLMELLDREQFDLRAYGTLCRTALADRKSREQFEDIVHERETRAQAEGDNIIDAKLALSLAIGNMVLGDYNEACTYFESAPDSASRWFFNAKAFTQVRSYEQALEAYDKAAAKGADQFDVTMAKVEALILTGRIDEAQQALNTQAASGQNQADYHYHKGWIAERQGDHQTAATCFTTALGIDPNHKDALFRLAYMTDMLGFESEAMELYERCVADPPVPLNALINLAVLYEDAGHFDDAVNVLKAVLEVNPNHARARLYLKDALSSQSMYYDEDQEKRQDQRNQLLDTPVTDFELSVRSRNCLKKMNIHTLGDLLRTTEADLLAYKNFGETSLHEIKAMLTQKGLRLGQSLDDGEGTVDSEEDQQTSEEQAHDRLLQTLVDDMNLSVRSRKCLQRLDVNTLGDLVSKTEAELLAAKNFGQTSMTEIKQKLEEFGLTLRKAK